MHITIDTNNITEADRAVLAFVLSGETDPFAASLAAKPMPAGGLTAEPDKSDKPKRARRTNAEISFDTAFENYQHKPDGVGNLDALREATYALQEKDPNNDRLSLPALTFALAGGEPAEGPDVTKGQDEIIEPEPDGGIENAGDELAAFEPVTIDQVVELATQLNAANKPRLREILEGFGAARVGALDESQYPEFAAQLRAELAKQKD